MINSSIQEDIKLVNTQYLRTKIYRQILVEIKWWIDQYEITVGNFSTLLKSMNKYFRQKINKTTVILIDMIDTITVTLNLYFQNTILKNNNNTQCFPKHKEHSSILWNRQHTSIKNKPQEV